MLYKSFVLKRQFFLWAVFFFSLPLLGCGQSLKGVVTLLDTIESTPATRALRNGSWLYMTDENNKLQVYDITDPKKPSKKSQVDAFTGPFYGMALFGNRLILLGEDGKLALFRVDDPSDPKPLWGRAEAIALPFRAGPFTINPQAGVMYMSPGNGKALARIELSKLNLPALPEAAIIATAVKQYDGSGGGGINLVTEANGVPVRLYTAGLDGKIGVWLVAELEQGTASAPATSISCALGDRLRQLVFFAEEGNNRLLAFGAAATGAPDIEVFDLGRNFTKASEPTSLGTASVGGLVAFDPASKIGVNALLEVWEMGDFLEPLKYAASELRSFNLRDMVIVGKILLTAEGEGFRVHEYSDR